MFLKNSSKIIQFFQPQKGKKALKEVFVLIWKDLSQCSEQISRRSNERNLAKKKKVFLLLKRGEIFSQRLEDRACLSSTFASWKNGDPWDSLIYSI